MTDDILDSERYLAPYVKFERTFRGDVVARRVGRSGQNSIFMDRQVAEQNIQDQADGNKEYGGDSAKQYTQR